MEERLKTIVRKRGTYDYDSCTWTLQASGMFTAENNVQACLEELKIQPSGGLWVKFSTSAGPARGYFCHMNAKYKPIVLALVAPGCDDNLFSN